MATTEYEDELRRLRFMEVRDALVRLGFSISEQAEITGVSRFTLYQYAHPSNRKSARRVQPEVLEQLEQLLKLELYHETERLLQLRRDRMSVHATQR